NQKITLFLKQSDTGLYKDTVIVVSVTAATFDISSWKIKPGLSYKIDFYADHNKNGTYDAPPIDHAWRISLDKVVSDTIVNFAHNTTFTDILPVATNSVISDKSGILRLYPNPASQYVELTIPENYKALNSLKVYNITGSLVEFRNYSGNSESIRYDVSQLKNGIYFMEVTTGNQRSVLKFIKD
ncbi:MAG: T9SS type A sorting domain-containing protein, partial [Mycobacteriaceae bacterium]|nr:T9SS type A sorting domain-containing protein [Mycobacteriaceae bacterium]